MDRTGRDESKTVGVRENKITFGTMRETPGYFGVTGFVVGVGQVSDARADLGCTELENKLM